MDQETAESLGAKLATLELTDDESTLLAILIGGEPEFGDEVEGFGMDADRATGISLNFEELKVTYAPVVVSRFLPDGTATRAGVERQ